MRGSSVARFLAFVVLLPGLASTAVAQDDHPDNATGYDAIVNNLDMLIDNYARFLGRKYDLTEEQEQYSSALIRERAYEFVERHDENLRELVGRLFDVRTGGEMTQEELVEWGRRVKPIYEDAKKIVEDGNNDWREMLTPEQKTIHDEDLKLMHESFQTTDDRIARIVSGEMTVEEFRSPQRKRSSQPTPARPARRGPSEPPPPVAQDTTGPYEPEPTAKPAAPRPGAAAKRQPGKAGLKEQRSAGGVPRRTTGTSGRPRVEKPERQRAPGEGKPGQPQRGSGTAKPDQPKFISEWEKYVRAFIEKYQLDDEQAQKANAVLEDCKSQAHRYLRGRKVQIEQLDQQIAELKLAKVKDKSKRLSELNGQRSKLMEPIDRIFDNQLKPRLERLPTRAQRRAAEAAAKKKPKAGTRSGKKGLKKPAEERSHDDD
jgi:hypothetical protein